MDAKRKNIFFRVLLYAVFGFYLLLLLLVLFRARHETRSLNLVPFRGIVSYLMGKDLISGADSASLLRAFALDNLAGNIVLFIPLGVYAALFNSDKSIWKNTLWILAASVAAELVQFTFKLGIGDIDDVILNTLGGLIGVLLYRGLLAACKDEGKARRGVAIAAPIIGVLSIAGLILQNR